DGVRTKSLQCAQELRSNFALGAAVGDTGTQNVDRKESEGLVLDDRSADAAGPLVPAEDGYHVGKDCSGIETIIGVIPGSAAVYLVGAGLRNGGDAGTRAGAILRGKVIHGNAQFLDGLSIGCDIDDATPYH